MKLSCLKTLRASTQDLFKKKKNEGGLLKIKAKEKEIIKTKKKKKLIFDIFNSEIQFFDTNMESIKHKHLQ